MTTRKPGRGVNATGRSKPGGKHVRLYWWLIESPAYRHLSCYGRALLVEFIYRHSGDNNGRVAMFKPALTASALLPPFSLSTTRSRCSVRER